MDTRPIGHPAQAHHMYWQPPQATPAQDYTMVENIIDSYAEQPAEEFALGRPPKTPEPRSRPGSRASGKRRQRTPSPLPNLRIPGSKKLRLNPQPQPPPPPVPAPAPEPLPEQQVPPYYIDLSAVPPIRPYHPGEMPPLMPVPEGPPVHVPMPQYGFLHQLPQAMEPHAFTPMFTTPNGRFKYYVFADEDGAAKVALIGRVDEMQELYQDLACRYPQVSPHAYAALLARLGTAERLAHDPAAPAE